MNSRNEELTEAPWLLATLSDEIDLVATRQAVRVQSRSGSIKDFRDFPPSQPTSRLGRLLPTLIPQLLEQGIATPDDGAFSISYDEFATLEERGFDAFEGVAPWSPFILGLESTSWLTAERFKYFLRFYLGNTPVDLARRGCFVRRGTTTYRLATDSFRLVSAVDAFNGLPPEERFGTPSLIKFAEIRGLAEEVGADLDAYLTRERVIIPSSVGLDIIVDPDDRITFVPKIDGVSNSSLRTSYLSVDDVDSVYTCATDAGERTRVVLNDEQREVFRRMQRVRHLGGASRTIVLRDPTPLFDGVGGSVDIDRSEFGARVKGIGDFPFVSRAYLQQSATGIFDGGDASADIHSARFSAGLECTYVDSRKEKLEFTSRDEVLRLKAETDDARRSGVGQIVFRGRSILVDEELARSLGQLVKQITKEPPSEKPEAQRRFLLIYTNEGDLEYREDVGPDLGSHDLELPMSLQGDIALKGYQRDGIAWLQRNFRLHRHGCLLADDMGLGKTLQTLVFLAWLIERHGISDQGQDAEREPWNPILIVAPAILLENEVWLKDMRRFFSGDGSVFRPWLTLHGKSLKTHRKSGATGTETVIGAPVLDLEALRRYRVILTNYETVTNYQHSFAMMKDRWSVVVTDEAQEYKTPNTKISHALKSLAPRFRIACTGTPVETRLLDVWNIFDFLQPGDLLGSAAQFSKRFERAESESRDLPSGSQLLDLRNRLQFGTHTPWVMRRNKTEVLADLPPKQEHRLSCDLSEDQRRWHLDLVGRARAGGDGNHPLALIQQLMSLSQHPALFPSYEPKSAGEAVSTCPKLATLLSALEVIRDKSEKALIFTRSLNMQQILSSVLQEKFGLAAEIVNGLTSRRGSSSQGQQTRQAIVRRFQESRGFDLIILSPDVAGVGLTLVEANHVFHYGRWWNPAKESQATDRAHRIGQTRPVSVYYLIAEDPLGQFDTFDQKLDAMIERRRALATDFLAPMPSEEQLGKDLLDDVVDRKTTTPIPAFPVIGEDGLRQLPWDRFEALIALIWGRRSDEVILTPKAGDEGVDVITFNGRNVELLQCKHTGGNTAIDVDEVADLIQAFEGYRARRFQSHSACIAIRVALVTNGSFTAGARRAAKERDVQLVSRADLVDMMAKKPCTDADIAEMQDRRLASMRDVQAHIKAFLGRLQ